MSLDQNLKISKSIEINANNTSIWNALTNPEIIKQYLFGTETISDWKKNSEIIFQGEYDGKKYRDRGVILEIEENKYLEYSYWTGFSGLEEKEGNYSFITYKIEENNSTSLLTLTQKGFINDEMKSHSEKSWEMILEKIKEFSEA